MSALDRLRHLAHSAPQSEWELQTGCSWRRIGCDGRDGNILRPNNHHIDGHPDLAAGDNVLGYIIAAQPRNVLKLFAEIDQLRARIAELEAQLLKERNDKADAIHNAAMANIELEHQRDRALEDYEAAMHRIADLEAQRVPECVGQLVAEIYGLTDESSGVAGLHLNGDIAPWSDLLPGGAFERLVSLHDVEALLDASAPQPNIAPEPLNIDDARLALWQAIKNIKIGNKTDDKLILDELSKLGYWIAKMAPSAPAPVAYLDIGAGGYTDVGSDLSDEQLSALPKGRHMLGIIGTYGVDGYSAQLGAVPVISQRHVLAITTAYEQGVGKGHYAAEHGKEISNPYAPEWGCDIAWAMGYEEGKEQARAQLDEEPVGFVSQDFLDGKWNLDHIAKTDTGQISRVIPVFTRAQLGAAGKYTRQDLQRWRDDALEAAAQICDRYGLDAYGAGHDIRVMKHKEISDAPYNPNDRAALTATGGRDELPLRELCYLYWSAYHTGHHDTVESRYTDVLAVDRFDYWADEVKYCLGSGDMPIIAAALTATGGQLGAVPDECGASGESCAYAPLGEQGGMQCKYCGKPQALTATGGRDTDDFNAGIMVAASILVSMHNDTILAADIIREAGLSDFDCSGLDEYDLINLRKVNERQGMDLRGLAAAQPAQEKPE